jgi:hypothetical protein
MGPNGCNRHLSNRDVLVPIPTVLIAHMPEPPASSATRHDLSGEQQQRNRRRKRHS